MKNTDKIICMNDYLTTRQQKDVLKFLKLLTKLEPLELIGVSKILGVEAIDIELKAEGERVVANVSPHIAENIISDSIDAFLKLDNAQRKNLFKILRQYR